MLKLIYSDNVSHYYRRQSLVHTVWYRTTVKDVHCSFITLEVHLVHTAQASSLPAVYGGHAIPWQVASTK